MPRSRAHGAPVTTGGWAPFRANARGFGWGYAGLAGLLGLVAIAWALNEDRRRIPWPVVGAGILLQIGLALLIKLPPVAAAFLRPNDGVGALQKATDAGIAFAFGSLVGAPNPLPKPIRKASFILAFRAFHSCW